MEYRHIPGLTASARITVDQWGIPHLRAENLHDLFFLQGYNAARERLWQIDLWRKRGLGLLSEDFGPGYLAQDRASRLFLYRGDMDAEWAAYCDDARAICEAFTCGINAFIVSLGDDTTRLPLEFRSMGTRPSRWQPEDVLRIRSHALMRNALSEVTRANVTAAAGDGVDLLRQNLDPPRTPDRADGVAYDEIPLDVLDVFKLALAAVTFDDDRLDATMAQSARWSKVAASGAVVRTAAAEGSNNWVVRGDRTGTGRPILANDPHRTQAVPSLRYLVHLTAPGLDVIGAGEPCLPGVCIGHNGTIAFGLTLFFGPDQEDVYVYETAPDDPDSYRYGDGWEKLRLVDEHAQVKGAGESLHRLEFTRHGPVVYRDRARHRLYAVRTVWSAPGTAPYAASLASMRARSVEEFRDAMKRWGVPATNQVYADVGGTTAWIATGFSPVRPNWDGLLPVSGEGRFEWQGFLTAADLPFTINPAAGFVATANEQNLPQDWPHATRQVGYEWIERSRINRITEVLSADRAHGVAEACALQTDILSIPARRLTALVQRLDEPTAAVSRAKAIFSGWNCRLETGSPAAALFEVWWSKHLRPGLITRVTPSATAIRALLLPGDPESILALLESPDGRLGGDPVRARDDLLQDTLAGALAECSERLGADERQWRWGSLHKGYFAHALTATARSPAEHGLDVGPLEKGGSDSTPMNAQYRPDDFRVTLGASVRIVIDVGEWDNSRCINAPGQSGDPTSPHYNDLAERWAAGEYVPLLYSQDRIDAAADYRIDLGPWPLPTPSADA